MSFSEEDWLIIDEVLNRVAKSLRRIELKDKQEETDIRREENKIIEMSQVVKS